MSSETPSEEADVETDWILMPDVTISSSESTSRIWVPTWVRNRHGIEEGDVLDVEITPVDPEKETVSFEEVLVGAQVRILLPHHRIEMRGLDNEDADVRIRRTGKTEV